MRRAAIERSEDDPRPLPSGDGFLELHCPSTMRTQPSFNCETTFAPGTQVCVTETTFRREQSIQTQVVGVVDAWENLPTGSWFAHGKKDKLWLKRLRLRKADGEITLLVLDDGTAIAKLEAVAK